MDKHDPTVERLFGAALELPAEHRSAFLDRACHGAPDLRLTVEELLLDNDRIGSFLERPLVDLGMRAGSADAISSAGQILPSPSSNPDFLPRFGPTDPIANRFEVVRFIARGGMGEVYEVKDQFLQGVNLALKIVRPEIASDAGSARRFEQEVILARSVTHPNLCSIYDIFRCDQPSPPFSFLTMKLLRGETLDECLKQSRKFPSNEAIEICRQLVAGVAALHDGGILHRDLKPNNVMLERTGNSLLVSIMDFGLARPHQFDTATNVSVTVAGTLGYMAPELLRGHPASKASDLFALGVVMHQVFTGERPAESQTDSSMVPLPALRSVHTPAYLVQVIGDFLSADLGKRARAFDVARSAESGLSSEQSSRFYARHLKALWFTVAVLGAFVVVTVATWLTSRPAPHSLASRQLTFSRAPKDRPLLSGGSRLYLQNRGMPAAMALAGGAIAQLRNFEPGMIIRAVSPDGSKGIAVKPDGGEDISHGELWIATLPNGAPRRLGAIVAQDVQWSPDGRSLVFADRGAVYTSDVDGANPKKIWEAPATADSLAVSPDGREVSLAVWTKDNSLLWRMNIDGTGAHPLPLDWPANVQEWYGQWTPNGKHFVFLSDREGAANVYELVAPRWFEFWKKASAVLVTGNQIGMLGLAPGPDGESLYTLAQLDQGEMQILDSHSGKFLPFLDGFPAIWFTVSPDKQWMAYNDYPAGNLWKSKLDGSEALQLTTTLGYMQRWSKDSKSLAYSDNKQLYLLSADGGTPEKLIPGGGLPSWGPDGKTITFAYLDASMQPSEGIYNLDLASHRVSLMPGTTSLTSPAWSPDGKYLLAWAKAPSRMMLYATKTKTWIQLRQIAQPPGGFQNWSRDSHSIYMRSIEGNGIFRLSVPGGKWEKVTGLENVHLLDWDGFPCETADGKLVVMSHTAVAQVYSLRWN